MHLPQAAEEESQTNHTTGGEEPEIFGTPPVVYRENGRSPSLKLRFRLDSHRSELGRKAQATDKRAGTGRPAETGQIEYLLARSPARKINTPVTPNQHSPAT